MIIAIDPGQTGAIAWSSDVETKVIPMLDTPKDILMCLRLLNYDHDKAFCWIERVGTYMPGNSGPAAVKFAKHCGHLDMALLAAGISYDTVLPAKWEHFLIGKPAYPKIDKETPKRERSRILAKRKTERKNKIKAKVQGLYPDIKVTLAVADALGILTWAINQKRAAEHMQE